MARRRDKYGDDQDEEEEYSARKRRRPEYIDDAAVEDDSEEEEDEYEEGGRKGSGSMHRGQAAKALFDLEAEVDSDGDEDEEEEEEDGFIDDGGADLEDEGDSRRGHPSRPSILDVQQEDLQMDIDELAQQIEERYGRSSDVGYGEEAVTEVEQQALLPSVKDPKLWIVQCQVGREREAVFCLMQKYIDKGSQLQITSAVALDHLKNYIYVEAAKESHVREACNGLRSIFSHKVQLVPIKEMSDVLSVKTKTPDLASGSWVRMKLGIYKGDLGKVVEVDNVRQRATVKFIPRLDLQAIADKMDGNVVKKKSFVPPPRFFNIEEAREMRIRVDWRRSGGVTYDFVDNMKFKDGFLYKTVSLKSICCQNVQPTFEELERFGKEDAVGAAASLPRLLASRKMRHHFMKGDAVVVVKGELKNLMGWVEKVDEENVHVRPNLKGLPGTLAFNENELCKYFKPGHHVKVVSGDQEGTTGMVVMVEGHVLTIVSDISTEHIDVLADHVVKSSETTAGVARIGRYELHDLVSLSNRSFGVVIRVEKDASRVLIGAPDGAEAVLLRQNEIIRKIDRKTDSHDCYKNKVSTNDVVTVVKGAFKGRQGLVKHIHSGVLFIYDRRHLEYAGFICAYSHSCVLVGGSHDNSKRKSGAWDLRFGCLRSNLVVQSPMRFQNAAAASGFRGRHGGRGHDTLVGKVIKIRLGVFKGHRGRVKEVKGNLVRVELDSQMKSVTVNRDQIADTCNSATPALESKIYGMGNETPIHHPSRTPLRPYMTPMRDPGATPIHDGMRTPIHDRAWNAYAPMSPPRDNYCDDANHSTWGMSSQCTPSRSPPQQLYGATNQADAGTPKGYALSPLANEGLPMTPGYMQVDSMSPTLGQSPLRLKAHS